MLLLSNIVLVIVFVFVIVSAVDVLVILLCDLSILLCFSALKALILDLLLEVMGFAMRWGAGAGEYFLAEWNKKKLLNKFAK